MVDAFKVCTSNIEREISKYERAAHTQKQRLMHRVYNRCTAYVYTISHRAGLGRATIYIGSKNNMSVPSIFEILHIWASEADAVRFLLENEILTPPQKKKREKKKGVRVVSDKEVLQKSLFCFGMWGVGRGRRGI